MRPSPHFRPAEASDAAAIARIYNEGISDRSATFETDLRDATAIAGWFAAGFPLLVAEDGEAHVVAWASAPPYRARRVYRGVAEFSIYVAREFRGAGYGRATLAALITECRNRGYWKLLSRIFPENIASRRLCAALGFREVGTYRRHAQLDGVWRDVVIVEILLDDTLRS
jgi:L-amino acid N-acyltransferase YncA